MEKILIRPHLLSSQISSATIGWISWKYLSMSGFQSPRNRRVSLFRVSSSRFACRNSRIFPEEWRTRWVVRLPTSLSYPPPAGASLNLMTRS